MRYSGPLSDQIVVFIRCIGLGVLLGLLYEAFSVLRCLLSDKTRAYVICDIAFSLIATVISFFFMILYNDGRVRLNLVVAQLLGGVAFHFSLGRYITQPISVAATKIRHILSVALRPMKKCFVRKKISRGDSAKKIKNIVKIPLKKRKK